MTEFAQEGETHTHKMGKTYQKILLMVSVLGVCSTSPPTLWIPMVGGCSSVIMSTLMSAVCACVSGKRRLESWVLQRPAVFYFCPFAAYITGGLVELL